MVFFAVFAAFAFIVLTGCGKSGPPLPPLVRLPAAPDNLVAERRGTTVDVEFTVPSANIDGTRPANVARVDVYAITAPSSISDDQILKHGTKVASVDVKAPRNPNLTVEPDESAEEMEPPEGEGLDQGAVARVAEQLTADVMTPYDPLLDEGGGRKPVVVGVDEETPRPLISPASATPSRTYVSVGISTRGRKGALSRRVAVALLPPPPAPAKPTVTYNETTIAVTWAPVRLAGMVQDARSEGVLESRPIGVPAPTVAYHVYVVTPPETEVASGVSGTSRPPLGSSVKLTKTPVAETTFEDTRIVWGERRCYTVRAVETLDGLSIESDAVAPECTTLTDTFPPAAPKGLQAVGGEASINLIWEPGPEKDLAGYVVLRGTTREALEPITPAPIRESGFTDGVRAGLHYFYAVKAVDRAGNASPPSAPADETARE